MTTTKPATQRAAVVWEPYPHLPREIRDMEQMPTSHYLGDMLRHILTPGDAYYRHPSILIGDQIPIYYGEPRPGGGPPPHIIPDCLIAFDVDTAAIWARVGYDPRQNGKPPDVAIEVASHSTYRNDNTGKRETYRRIGVPEYWRFDPTGGRLYGRPIIGEQLVNEQYERLPLVRYDDGSEGSTSPIMNVNFRWREPHFRVLDPTTGAEYEHPIDAVARLHESNSRQQEEIDRLQAEIRRLRGEG